MLAAGNGVNPAHLVLEYVIPCFVFFDEFVLACIYAREDEVREACLGFGVNDREVGEKSSDQVMFQVTSLA